jgi:large subunit ribosomal protein L37Ae
VVSMANFSIRYGTRIRKRFFEIKHKKQAKYKCESCGKIAVKRIETGIWQCKHCNNIYAGAAYSFTSEAGERSKKLIDAIKK